MGDDYTLGLAEQDAFNEYWPDWLTPEHPHFLDFMQGLQAELINLKRGAMDDETGARADRTLDYLAAQCG